MPGHAASARMSGRGTGAAGQPGSGAAPRHSAEDTGYTGRPTTRPTWIV